MAFGIRMLLGNNMKEEIINRYFKNTVCPKCGKETHEAIAGEFIFSGDYLVQRHCSNCHYTDVTNHMTGMKREGILKDRW